MQETAVLVITDSLTVQHWIGNLNCLVSSTTDYVKADIQLLPTQRLFSVRAIGFTRFRSWLSYTDGDLYETVHVYHPRLLSELAKNYHRLADTLEQSSDWRPLRSYGEDEQLSPERLLAHMEGRRH